MDYQAAIREAYNRGYRVHPDGRVRSPFGRWLVLTPSGTNKRRLYPAFGIRMDGKVYSVWVHRLAAYQVYGELIFTPGLLVRHLNDDPRDNRFTNLALGSAYDNARDRARLRDTQPC